MAPGSITIEQKGKAAVTSELAPGVYTIGADDDCGIRLRHTDIEGRHAILTVGDADLWLEDLESAAGTLVDGARAAGRVPLPPGQPFSIGPFTLTVVFSRQLPAPPSPAADDAAQHTQPAPGDDIETRRAIKQQIHKELVDRLDIKRLSASRVSQDDLRQRALITIRAIVNEVAERLPPGISPAALAKEICDEALALGPLEQLLDDEEITEIMVNGPSQVYVEKGGVLVETGQSFMDDSSVMAVIERIVSPLGRRIDESQPYVDARLPDGSRVNAIIPPLSLTGPTITIRKFSKNPFTEEDLVRFGTLPQAFADFLSLCVRLRKNIVVSGGTGSGKTTLLNALSGYLPSTERILTIEDAAELRLTQRHVVRLEARPPNIEGRGAITIRDLVRNALRMRPDRIVVGECRGGEALDMLQAMNTGHDGSLTTVHANSPRDVISRLETMVLMSGMDLPVRAIREQIAAAIDMIVHEARFSDGSRKVTRITEVVGLEGEQVTMQDIFEFEQTGVDADGHVCGQFRPTGAVPTFIEDVLVKGFSIDRTMFDPIHWQAKLDPQAPPGAR